MPRRRKVDQPVELEAAATIEGWDDLDEASRRRIRNRLSQRHFRERKSMYIKTLEQSSKASSQSESARNKALAKEIADLRAATLKIRAQILKISYSLNYVGAEVGKILNIDGTEDPKSVEPEDGRPKSVLNERARDDDGPQDFNCYSVPGESTAFAALQSSIEHESATSNDSLEVSNSRESADLESRPGADVDPQGHHSHLFDDGDGSFPEPEEQSVPTDGDGQHAPTLYPETTESQASNATFFSAPKTRSAISSYEDVPNLDYAHFTSTTLKENAPTAFQESEHQSVNSLSHDVPAQTNLILPQGHFPPCFGDDFRHNFSSSTFAKHIETLELQVRYRFDAAPNKFTRQMLIRSCSTIMSLFVQNAWPPTYSVWFKSQVPDIIGPILLWRVSPSHETYNLLGANYKPTELQLSVPHSAVIDWIPYADLRDKVIEYYNHSVVLDRLLCDMMNSYVIEVADLSQILPQAPRGSAYFGIWNIFRAIDAAFEPQGNDRRTGSPSGAEFNGEYTDEAAQDVENPFDIYNEFALSKQSPRCCGNDRDVGSRSKPFNLVDILTTPASVLKLSHDIRLYATRSWRFDRTLFDKYPELKFNGYENIVAKGRSCRIPTAPPDAPEQMTDATIQIYQRALADIA